MGRQGPAQDQRNTEGLDGEEEHWAASGDHRGGERQQDEGRKEQRNYSEHAAPRPRTRWADASDMSLVLVPLTKKGTNAMFLGS